MSVRDDQLDTLKVGGKDYDFYRIADLPGIDHLPYSLKVLVENLVRNIDGGHAGLHRRAVHRRPRHHA